MRKLSARRMTGWPVQNTSTPAPLHGAERGPGTRSRVRIEGTRLGDNFRDVDGHAMGNSSRPGRICLLSAAFTV